jgi:hypothetical protein
MKIKGRSTLAAFVAMALIAGTALAQESRGRIQGLVTDTSGGVVPGASVKLKNDHTGVESSRVTNRDGRFLFDYVDPGNYSITVELTGFKTKVQQNILAQQRADVTVDVRLEVGDLVEVITVTESPVAVQFNTATRDLTVEQKMVRDLPSSTRNPLQLALLDPMTINRGNTVETQPYHHRSANEMDLGGGTKYRNDVVLDGTPLTAGNKLGYTPPMDAVTEYTVQQNAIDAEFGHNSGGVAVVTMKSGSNDVRGSAYYYGRSPDLNAMSDRALRRHSENPYWNAGATVGLPVVKNKLFVFGVFERIENTSSQAGTYTLPTPLERQGDFSQSYNADGTLRVIYDPLTTRLGPDGKTYIRDPFPGNKIPQSRWDPLATKIFGNLWSANNAGDDKTGFNNFKYNEERKFHYYNFSTRIDWQISPKWKAYGRISRMKTDQDAVDFTEGNDPLKLRNVTGSKRNGWNVAADTVYMFNPTTSLNLRGAFYQVEDKRDYPEMNIGDYSGFWPNGWWQPYMEGRPLVYAPYIVVESTSRGLFGVRNFWYQEPEGYSFHARFNKYIGKHSLKAGGEVRYKRGQAARFLFGQFQFIARETANTFASPNTKTGHPWASFLLGAMDPSNSLAQYTPMQVANTEMWAGYVQDDIKVTKDLTLNLGLRYEYEGGLWDPQYRIQQQLDLTDPIPGMQAAIDPKIPADIKSKMAESTGQNSYIYNGAFSFTSAENKRGTNADKLQLMPRLGLAWRLDQKTAVRAGYGRFYTPVSLIMPDRDVNGEMPMGMYTPSTSVLPLATGKPQAYFANPFPQGVTPAIGSAYGRYTLLGDSVTIDEYVQKPPVSDRINVSIQRQLPGRIVADFTYFINFVGHDQWPQNLNMMDPRLSFKYGSALAAQVPNPFYNYGTVATFPGALRRQSTVAASALLVPYPQYQGILQTATDLRKTRYQSFQFRLQRPFSKGFSFLVTYAYATARTQAYYDTQDEYDGLLQWIDGAYSPPGGTGTTLGFGIDPVHRVAAAGTVQLPFGRGRAVGSDLPTALDAIVGGWEISGMFNFSSGQKLVFGGMVAPSSVQKIGEVGSNKYWFDVAGFKQLPAYTRRTNPWTYDNLTGPSFSNLDLSLAKRFNLSQRFKMQLRLEAYNALNGMNWANPQLSITASDFGRTNTQASGYYGRQLQYSVRLEF